jgi:hypothetical protein
MAYKFQVGPASLSGSLKRSGSMDIMNASGVSSFTVDSSSGNISGSGTLINVGAASFGSTIAATGSITAGSSFIIGSADLNEVDMEKLDGITNGTAAVNKAVVLDGSKNIATLGTVGCGAITSTGASTMGSLNIGGTLACDTSFTLDAVVINATELGFIDGVTAGTAAASKALVVSADKDIGTIRNLTIDGTFSDGNYTFDTSGNVTGLGTVGCGAVTSTGNVSGTTLTGSTAVRTGGADAWGFSSAGTGKFHSMNVGTSYGISNSGALTASVATVSGLSSLQAVTASSTLGVEGATSLKGTVALPGVAVEAIAVASDSMFFLDADGLMKKTTNALYAAALVASEPGLASSGGKLLFDPSSCAAVTPATGDSLVFADADDTDIPKKATLDAFAGVLAGGAGIAASGVALSLDLNGLAAYANVTPASDSFAILSNASGSVKSTFTEVASRMAGAGITATNGVFSVDTTGGDSMSRAAIANGGTVAVGLNYFAALVADATVTLPASPTAGDICVIKAHTIAAGKEIIINRGHSSQTIDGLATISMRSNYGAVTLIAATAGNTADWRLA